MAEVKKDANVIAWGTGLEAAKAAGKTSVSDFTGSSDFVQLKAGETVQLKNAVWKSTSTTTFPVFECYKGTQFVGYISFRKLQGLRYDGILTSKSKGTKYSKFTHLNRWGAPEGTTFGHESLQKSANGKKITVREKIDQMIPAYVEGAEPTEELMVEDYYLVLEAK